MATPTTGTPSNSPAGTGADRSLASLGLRLSDWFERWFPDAFALALVATLVVAAASVLSGSSALETAQRFGSGFWDLATFTLQMSMIVVTGYAVATSPPVYAVVRKLAAFPTTGPGAVAYVGLFSMLASLLSWSFSLIFSGLLAKEVAHRVKGADYRAIGAAAYLGVGSVWALGLSSSAALIMASSASLPDSVEAISGVIPLSQTLGLWQSMVIAGALIVGCGNLEPAPRDLEVGDVVLVDVVERRVMRGVAVGVVAGPLGVDNALRGGRAVDY